jgi:hypothetical protein
MLIVIRRHRLGVTTLKHILYVSGHGRNRSERDETNDEEEPSPLL